LLYAGASALAWYAIVEIAEAFDDAWNGWIYATGAVFGALVLVPHLEDLRGSNLLRAVGLCAAGTVSYWTAHWLYAADFAELIVLPGAMGSCTVSPVGQEIKSAVRAIFDVPPLEVWAGCEYLRMCVAGVWRAVVVGAGAALLVPLRIRGATWLWLAAAGAVGGAGIAAGASLRDVDTFPRWLPGHAAWQVLVCAALVRVQRSV
jgi:hypothetical protein